MRSTVPARLLAAGPLLVLLGVTASACDPSTGPDGSGPPAEITELPRALSVTETRVLDAANDFGFDLLGELNADAPAANLFVSPLSAHMALGMALNGAHGGTFDAMRDALGFAAGADLVEINQAYVNLLDLLMGLDESVEFELANSVWYEQTFPFRDSFLDAVRAAFGARVEGMDFRDPAAPGVINAWVDEQTRGRIDKLVDAIDPAEVMLLLNAIYFKGDWRVGFDPDRTYDAPFHLDGGGTVPVPMMVRDKAELLSGHTGSAQIVDLPYGGGAFRMTIVLPEETRGLSDVLAGLDGARWSEWMSSLSSGEAGVELPRFQMEWSENLNDALKRMGMTPAFQPGVADFGGMLADGFDPQAAGTDLHITKVKQKTFIDVNEEGTEAAAATSVGIGVTSAPLTIRVDRPFLFALRERLSGTVLFVGLMRDPAQ